MDRGKDVKQVFCDCCRADMLPKHDGQAVLQTTVQISGIERTLCAACMHVVKWVDGHNEKPPTDGNPIGG